MKIWNKEITVNSGGLWLIDLNEMCYSREYNPKQ